MLNRASAVFTVALLICLAPVAGLAMTPYAQDFESLDQADPNALGNDGWLVYGNVFTPAMVYIYGYGPYPAPNHALAFSAIAVGEGGVEQGAQQVSVFSDYENTNHAVGNIIESNFFQEQTIAVADTGSYWVFAFQGKRGNLEGASTAAAFIKTIDPGNNYAMTNLVTVDMTSADTTWGGSAIQLYVGSNLVGQLFQFGFLNTASNYEGSGIFYDNVQFYNAGPVAVPEARPNVGATLQNNYPNPFSPRTRIEFAVEEPGHVELAIFDLAGRRIATLRDEEFAVGEYGVTWDGRTDRGAPAAAGQYWYVLRTVKGQVAQRMTLLK